jgi:hypothetical protein
VPLVEFVRRPHFKGASIRLHHQALIFLALWLVPRVALPCAPSATHACVSHDAGTSSFWIDLGPGLVRQPTLNLTVGSPFTFELSADGSDYASHPFTLTTNKDGGAGSPFLGLSDGVTGTNPANTAGQTSTFSPVEPGTYYYQCDIHKYEGGYIVVAPGAVPDSGATDAGGQGVDAGPPDSGVTPDAGSTPDSGEPQADAGAVAPDAGSSFEPDAGPGSPPTKGCGCGSGSASITGPLFGLVLCLLASSVARRKSRRMTRQRAAATLRS